VLTVFFMLRGKTMHAHAHRDQSTEPTQDGLLADFRKLSADEQEFVLEYTRRLAQLRKKQHGS
jgi:hypothetical protein